jgi:hypothetical protein
MTDEQLNYLLWEYFWDLRWQEAMDEIEREEAAGIPGPELPEALREPPTWKLRERIAEAGAGGGGGL